MMFGGSAAPAPRNESVDARHSCIASIALHEKLGFRKIGVFPEVGWKLDTWLDVGYWELTLETV